MARATASAIQPETTADTGDSGRGDRIARHLLAWYDRHHRDLPWRVPPSAHAAGLRADPYHVWLSEVMLQQTTVEAVKPYFRDFLARWPTVGDLAAAPREAVMQAWAGLGYYARARNLKACAETVAARGGDFPQTEETLRELPGVGAYTAAAVAAIAFGQPAAVVDGNVERVVTRLEAIDVPMPKGKEAVRAAVASMLPADRPGDFAQAMMDLGATICTPKRPHCLTCPLRGDCRALAAGDPEAFPVKAPKPDKPVRRGAAFVAVRGDGAVLVRRRPDSGLLGGMVEVPTTAWTARADGETSALAAPLPGDWRDAGTISHVFTHFALVLHVYRAAVDAEAPQGHWWCPADALAGEALPTVMRKAVASALPAAGKPGRTRRAS